MTWNTEIYVYVEVKVDKNSYLIMNARYMSKDRHHEDVWTNSLAISGFVSAVRKENNVSLFLLFSIGHDAAIYNSNYMIKIHHDGQTEWYCPAEIKSICHIDIKDFPFDTQQCRLKFGSWIYTGEEVSTLEIIWIHLEVKYNSCILFVMSHFIGTGRHPAPERDSRFEDVHGQRRMETNQRSSQKKFH